MQLGTTKEDRIELPDAVLEHHSAVLGKTGSGKTSTAKLLIEYVANSGGRVCILDPIKSDWWGLTSSADGKKPGLPFHILGGPHGHVPLHESAGRAIGEIVANGALPLSIIDMADFRMGGLQSFFVDFAEALLKKKPGPVYLVLEEAHEFAPKELAGVRGENMGMYWAKKLATAGRSKGLRLVVLTQRTQALHNALLGSCETMIVHRMTAPADQKPAIDWLKANASKDVAKEVAESLSSLKTGEGWVCSGEAQLFERIKFPRISTYDNTSGRGDGRAVKTSPVDTDKLRSIVGEAIEEAKANDPKVLKEQLKAASEKITQLERAASEQEPAAPVVETVVDQAAIDDAYGRGRAEVIAEFDKRVTSLLGTVSDGLEDISNDLTAEIQTIRDGRDRILVELHNLVLHQLHAPLPARATKIVRAEVDPGNGEALRIGSTHQLILDTVAWFNSIGNASPTWEQLCSVAGRHPGTKGMVNARGELRSHGYLDDLVLTASGRRQAKKLETAPTLRGLHEKLRERLDGTETKIFNAIVKNGGRIKEHSLAPLLGYHPGTKSYVNARGRLANTYGLVRYEGKHGDRTIVGTTLMYPEGLK